MSTHQDVHNEDILIDASAKALLYYHENKQRIIGIAVAALVLLSGIIGYTFWKSNQENQAQVLLGIAEQYLAYGEYNGALFGIESEFTIGFTQISDQYSSTDAGNLAHYYAAIAHFELQNFEDAAAHIRKYNQPDGILGVGSLTLLGEILTELGNYDEAAETFVRAAEWNENSVTTPELLLEAALSWERAGSLENAQQIVDQILTKYPQSLQVTRAEVLKGSIAARL